MALLIEWSKLIASIYILAKQGKFLSLGSRAMATAISILAPNR